VCRAYALVEGCRPEFWGPGTALVEAVHVLEGAFSWMFTKMVKGEKGRA